MSNGHSSRLPVVISSFALAVSIAATYWNLWRPVTLELELGSTPDVFLSNTLGGVADAAVNIALRGNGSPDQALLVQQLRMTITPDGGKGIVLESNRSNDGRGPSIPLIVRGKDVVSAQFFFRVNDYVPDQISRFETWCDGLGKFGDPSSVKEMKAALRAFALNEELPIKDESAAFTGGTRDRIRELARKILDGREPDQLRSVLFLSAGNYEVEISAIGANATELDRKRFSFVLDETMSKVLRRQFDVNVRVRGTSQSSAVD
jgi:hypothetical protein